MIDRFSIVFSCVIALWLGFGQQVAASEVSGKIMSIKRYVVDDKQNVRLDGLSNQISKQSAQSADAIDDVESNSAAASAQSQEMAALSDEMRQALCGVHAVLGEPCDGEELAEAQDQFGGMFTRNRDGTCRYPNGITGRCSCPAGASASRTLEWDDPICLNGRFADNERADKCGIEQFQCVFPTNADAASPADNTFGGFFTKNLDRSCRYPNPFTGACACPSGARSARLLEWSDPECRNGRYADGFRTRGCGFLQMQCSRQRATEGAFRGAFTKNLDGTCRYPNPRTNACRCPSGSRPVGIYEFDNPECIEGRYADGRRTENCGIQSFVCMP